MYGILLIVTFICLRRKKANPAVEDWMNADSLLGFSDQGWLSQHKDYVFVLNAAPPSIKLNICVLLRRHETPQ